MTTVTWKKPSVPGAAQFAQWNGANFAFVRDMPDGRWRAAVFPEGKTEHSMDAYAGSENQAKRWVERWAAAHHAIIKPVERKRMPHEGELKPRKPKGAEDRS